MKIPQQLKDEWQFAKRNPEFYLIMAACIIGMLILKLMK